MKRRIDHDTAVDAADAVDAATAIAVADKALDELDQAALSYAFVSMLGNADTCVRNEAVSALSKFGRYRDWLVPMSHVIGNIAPDILASHVGFTESMHSMLEDVHPEPGSARWSAIGRIFECAEAAVHKPPMLSSSCTAFSETLLTDYIHGRSSRTANLTNLTLNAHITTIIGRLADPDVMVRGLALDNLGDFHPGKLTSHVGSIIGLLANQIPDVRNIALHALYNVDRATLIAHTRAIVSMLTDSEFIVRCDALGRLRDFEYAALAPFATDITNAILYMLVDPDADVRYNALHAFYTPFMGLLAPDAMAVACTVVTKMLTDTDHHILTDVEHIIRMKATNILHELKKARGRLNWSTARVYRARPYGRFWYEDVGKSLCAPGGKWAKNDCAAFEAEFNTELHL